jgi:hypothetical protein
MFGFVKGIFAAKPGPIGVDLGTDTIRLAQCMHDGKDWRLIAAACTDVPSGVRASAESKSLFIVEAVRELLSGGNFKGRDAVAWRGLMMPKPAKRSRGNWQANYPSTLILQCCDT